MKRIIIFLMVLILSACGGLYAQHKIVIQGGHEFGLMDLVQKDNRIDFDHYMKYGDFIFRGNKFFDEPTQLEKRGKFLRFLPVDANHSRVRILDGDTALFRDAWNNIDVKWYLSNNKLKEDIIIKNSSATDSISWEMTTNASWQKLQKYIYLENGLTVNPPIAFDALKKPITVLTYTKKISGIGYLSYVWKKPDTLSSITYPIIIDPTITIQSDTTTMWNAVMWEDQPTTNRSSNADVQWHMTNEAGVLRNWWLKFSSPSDIKYLYSDSIISARLIMKESADNGATTPAGWKAFLSARAVVYNQVTHNAYSTGSNWQLGGGRGASDIYRTIGSDSVWLLAPGVAGRLDTFNITVPVRKILGKDSVYANNGFVIVPNDTTTSQGYNVYFRTEGNTEANRWKVEIEYLEGFTVNACSLKFGDTTSVSVLIDSVYNSQGNSNDSTQQICIWNSNWAKYYWIDGNSISLNDTVKYFTAYLFKKKVMPLRANSDNFIRIITQGRSASYTDTVVQIKRVGSPSGLSIIEGGDTLIFRLYDNQGNFKWFRVDSLLQKSRLERYTYNSPVFAFAIVDRWREYAWRRMQEQIYQWN